MGWDYGCINVFGCVRELGRAVVWLCAELCRGCSVGFVMKSCNFGSFYGRMYKTVDILSVGCLIFLN